MNRKLTVKADVDVAHNYSTQTLNSTELAKEKLRQILAKVSMVIIGLAHQILILMAYALLKSFFYLHAHLFSGARCRVPTSSGNHGKPG